MKEGNADIILDKVMKRYNGVNKVISLQTKGIKPFASEPISSDEQIWAIDNLTVADLDLLRDDYGEEGLAYLQVLRDKLKRRRR